MFRRFHTLAALGALAVAGAVLLPAGGASAQYYSCQSTQTVEAGGVYIDIRGPADGSVWIYQESNGIAGLQKGGTSDLSDDSSCAEFDAAGNQIPPDTLIF